MEDICATCLANDRSLKKLNKAGVFGILKRLMEQAGYNKLRGTNKVCWECIAQLKNVRKFQTKALDSLQRLQEYSSKSEIHNEYTNTSLTTLGIQKLRNLNMHDDLSDSDDESYDEIPELDDDDANASKAPVKLEEYGDVMFIENDLGNPVNSDPFSTFKSEPALDDKCQDEINNIKNDVVEQFDDNLQLQVLDFAHIKQDTSVNENDKSINDDTLNADLASLTPIIREAAAEPTWRPEMSTNEQLPSCRNLELNSTRAFIKTDGERTNNEVIEESLLKINENLVYTTSEVDTKIETCRSVKLPPKETVISTKAGFKKQFNDNKFICDICKREYNKKIKLVQHIDKHNTNSMINKKTFDSHAGEKNVKARIHVETTKKTFNCHWCKYVSIRKSDLKRHIRTHSDEKPFKCDLCEHRVKWKRDLVSHIRTHTGEKPFECYICDYKANQKNLLTYHIRTHTGEKPFKCDSCEFRTMYKRSLIRHTCGNTTHRHTGDKLFKCNSCEFRTNHKESLTRHARIHTGEKPFKCHLCVYRTTQKCHLTIHIRKHTSETPFKCHLCEYKTNQKFYLTRHLQVHTRENEYILRKYGVKRQSHSRSHVRIHSGEKPFECHICEFGTKYKGDLVNHIRTHTGEKRFQCHLCEYKAIRRGYLINHIRTHTGEKPFECHICEYRAKYKATLINHIRTHTGEKPFKCDLCEYRAIQKGSLLNHILTHSKESNER